ncbi:NADH-quinone oxidoreductase subunit L [Fontisphaera persica]|uniref:NADH-quinone oxidoreductase subunit L n=1 Tax=Fontisphaera persica TaxID=2974023 RepID=UPI0024BFB409|nr:NADH-quinone oxidoreductase subunit L [Fontisphaera persica]WCJ60562.1 NADH-quinone oxidoreductase subunit L [Fontisphaera persica]
MEHPENLLWLALAAPLGAAVLITCFFRKEGRFSAGLSIGAVGLSFVVCSGLFVVFGLPAESNLGLYPSLTEWRLPWLQVGGVKVSMALRMDFLSLLMSLVVTGVGGLIHLYSAGYMAKDPHMGRYFAGLSLFTFAMLGIVFANDLITLFIFWELVGVSSYLLIGFWHERAAAANAARKAFLTNRLGDFGFLLGILVIWGMLGTLDFDEIRQQLASRPDRLGDMAGVAGLLIFCGAMGKSAQFPLHVWLPDAMEGPTPVSALIHAATMVAAGVYMLCRLFFLYTVPVSWPESLAFLQGVTPLDIIAMIGGITALLAALIAVQQSDIKRILAYSTLSQLGYMIMAVGLLHPQAAMFHLTTHAFFKALLFLGAGSVIHALHHEQDIWQMGGLRRRMPVTWLTFLVATLALCGFPPLSGFYSKDAILAAAQEKTGLFILAVGTAGLTSFYMFRLVFVAFCGAPRSAKVEHAHESPSIMTVPLVLLAVFSAAGGVIGIPAFLQKMPDLAGVAGHMAGAGKAVAAQTATLWNAFIEPFHHAPKVAALGLAASLFGLLAAWLLYGKGGKDPLPASLGVLSRLMRDRFVLDEIYEGVIYLTHDAIARLAAWVDTWIISGVGVRGAHGATELAGRALRLLQTGNVQTYAFLLAAGLALVLWWKLGR